MLTESSPSRVYFADSIAMPPPAVEEAAGFNADMPPPLRPYSTPSHLLLTMMKKKDSTRSQIVHDLAPPGLAAVPTSAKVPKVTGKIPQVVHFHEFLRNTVIIGCLRHKPSKNIYNLVHKRKIPLAQHQSQRLLITQTEFPLQLCFKPTGHSQMSRHLIACF
jgi:hypothetical protein